MKGEGAHERIGETCTWICAHVCAKTISAEIRARDTPVMARSSSYSQYPSASAVDRNISIDRCVSAPAGSFLK